MLRGEVWWANLPDPAGSEPGYRRPVLVLSADAFNRSAIRTVVAAALSSNLRLARSPGNVFLARRDTGLSRDSVVNVTQLMTVDKRFLAERIAALSVRVLAEVEHGVRLALGL